MDGTYAPQSPDLSSFLSSPSKTAQPYSTSSSYAPRSPVLPTAHSQNYNAYAVNQQFGDSDFAYPQQGEYMPPIPALPPSHSFPQQPQEVHPHQDELVSPYFSNQRPSRNPNPTFDSYSPVESTHPHPHYPPQPQIQANPNMSARGPRIKGEPSTSSSSQAPRKDPNPTNIEIRTKFPVARIKRIMQADEEVGKVAQVTPVVVSKALELFMIALVTGAAEKAKAKGSKKVGASHLKAVVMDGMRGDGGEAQFDFLAEIVGRVGDGKVEGEGEKEGKRKKKEESEESEEDTKKVKKGRGRKKKGEE